MKTLLTHDISYISFNAIFQNLLVMIVLLLIINLDLPIPSQSLMFKDRPKEVFKFSSMTGVTPPGSWARA